MRGIHPPRVFSTRGGRTSSYIVALMALILVSVVPPSASSHSVCPRQTPPPPVALQPEGRLSLSTPLMSIFVLVLLCRRCEPLDPAVGNIEAPSGATLDSASPSPLHSSSWWLGSPGIALLTHLAMVVSGEKDWPSPSWIWRLHSIEL